MVAHVVDSSVDERFSESESLMMSGLRSFIAAPLLDAQGALGMIVVGAALGVRSFRDEDLELLVSLASVAALRIRNVRLVAEAMERQKLEQEVRLARQIQVALLPASLPPVPGWELYGGTLPSRGVSGDFYKVLLRGDGVDLRALRRRRLGQGGRRLAPDRLARGALGAPARGDRPARRGSASRWRRSSTSRTPPEKYATAFLGILDPSTGRLRWTNAGHNPALLLRASGEAEWLKSNGVPLGLLPGARYKEGRDDDGGRRRPPRLHRRDHRGAEPRGGGVRRGRGSSRRPPGTGTSRSARWRPALERDLDAFARGVPFHDDRTLVIVRRSL